MSAYNIAVGALRAREQPEQLGEEHKVQFNNIRAKGSFQPVQVLFQLIFPDHSLDPINLGFPRGPFCHIHRSFSPGAVINNGKVSLR